MKHFFRKIYRSWLFETILALVLLIVGIAYFNRDFVSEYASEAGKWMTDRGPDMIVGLSESILALLSPKMLALILGGLVLFLVILWRIIWRFRKSARMKTYSCPRCSQPLVRIHRKGWQKAMSKVMPIRRLYCRKCGWRGLRLKEVDNTPMDSNSTGETTKYNIDKIKG
jgi:hypothetical protein